MNSLLDRIQKTLDEIVSESDGEYQKCFYGFTNVPRLAKWNYFVFRRKVSHRTLRREPVQTDYEINIVHEDYIPEGFIDIVINKLEARDESGTKLKLSGNDITYNYMQKGNTDCVIEIATLVFTHPERG